MSTQTHIPSSATAGNHVPGTRERILQAAETLFGARGIDAVSLREVTTAAGVNSAALHYHFGSKEALLAELFQLRAQPIAERRVELLSKVRRENGRPVLDDILRAFLAPALEVRADGQGAAFIRLRAWLAFEPAHVRQEMLGKAFNESSRAFLDALAEALPELPRRNLEWRFHFLLGAMVYTMASPGRIESLTERALTTSDSASALEELVAFAAAGFREHTNYGH
ncbi:MULTISPECIES: TetR/AcrR family transcriptional regulator [Cupriavidus]|uniref:AcrR family transcriptional regulator n=1 Tax=Cupriavidus alkaliphilus TaxID=942866 RepID=A0A7W4VE62_9BURK|nr:MULTISPECIES: TetR/AcrR family transcriptional regulator [Cupriavidus]MBB3009936.1 AcrR family transcriptional regulator [Cupriavidus alkaliphilus]GLC97764.1 TetR family transcriptional regulator [Cupriavidus sp. TA19]